MRRSSVPWIVFNPSHILGPGDRHNWARLIVMVDREKLPGIPPGIGSFADVREIARAQVRAWQRQQYGEAYLVGGEHASFVDLVHRVGDAMGKRTPRGATPAWALMTFAHLANAWSRVTGKEPDVATSCAHRFSLVAGCLELRKEVAEKEDAGPEAVDCVIPRQRLFHL